MKKPKLSITLIFLCLIFILAGCKKEEEVSRTDFLMDTFITQFWQGENAQKTYDEIKALLEKEENALSSYKEESELTLLNKMSGKEPVKVEEETFAVLKRAKELSEISKGSFDITVAPLVKLWDVTGKEPHVPGKEEIKEKMSLVSYENLILDEASQTAFLKNAGMEIDLGALLKGYLAEKCLLIAENNGVRGYISVGGDMAVSGKKSDGRDFIMGIRNPRGSENEYIGTLTMEGTTMATAGDYERFFIEDGRRYHHILDPFTGYPKETDLISVSCVSDDGLLADFLSTYIFMEGGKNLSKFDGCEEFSFVAVDKDLNVYVSEGLRDSFEPNLSLEGFNFLL